MILMPVREPRVLALVLVVVGALALLLFTDFYREARYVEEPLMTLPWSQDGDGLGLADLRDGRRQGPASFAVDAAGRIWIADTARGRVVVARPGAGIETVWPVPLPPPEAGLASSGPAGGETGPAGGETGAAGRGGAPWIVDLAPTRDGGVLLADAAGARILDLGPDGALRRVIALPQLLADEGEDRLLVLERVAVDPAGVIYLAQAAVSDQAYVEGVIRLEPGERRFARVSQLVVREGGVMEVGGETLLPGPVHSFAVDRRGELLVETPGGGPFVRVVRRFDEAGRLLDEWEVASDSAVRDAAVVGRDPLGGLVVVLNPGRPEGRLVRLTAAGDTAFVRPVPWNPQFPATVFARMDAAGHVYLAVPDEGGWHLLRLRLGSRLRVVPAGLREAG